MDAPSDDGGRSQDELQQPFLVQYGSGVYDLTTFAHKHPGGRNTLNGLQNRDMTKRFQAAPPHSEAAMYLMQEYRVANKKFDWNNNSSELTNEDNDEVTKQPHQETKKRVSIIYTDNDKPIENQQSDESMEHLVDWTVAMVPQIGKLGTKYAEWVNKPVDRPLRLFASDWAEMLTKTPWWIVPTFWVPAIAFIVRSGLQKAWTEAQITNQEIVLSCVAGMLLWTIIEYTLHRWVFHLDTAGAGVALCTFHFMLHGLHHKVPFDPYRLVFPPIPAVAIASLFYMPISYACSCPRIVIAGGLMGYLCYDMIHYYIHYGSPAGGSYLYNLKRYHYQHHFVHHDQGFGISSPIWDDVFGTRILLRKLQYFLKW